MSMKINFTVHSKQRSGLHILFVLQNVAGMIFPPQIWPSCLPSVLCPKWITWKHQSLRVLQTDQVWEQPLSSRALSWLLSEHSNTGIEAFCLCHSQWKGMHWAGSGRHQYCLSRHTVRATKLLLLDVTPYRETKNHPLKKKFKT